MKHPERIRRWLVSPVGASLTERAVLAAWVIALMGFFAIGRLGGAAIENTTTGGADYNSVLLGSCSR